jgi:tetratricopeptide (TPR) repeat protein
MTGRIPWMLALLLSFLASAGCSGMDRIAVRIQEPKVVDVSRYRQRAEAFEAENELEASLLYWKVIRSQTEGSSEAEAEIERLRAEIQRRSDRFLEKGAAALEAGRVQAGRRQLLEALRIDSQNAQALELLWASAGNQRFDTHTVKPSETFRSLAERYYGDPDKAALLARFNDMAPDAAPVPGNQVLVPKMDAPPAVRPSVAAAKPSPPAKTAAVPDVEEARRHYGDGRYGAAAEAAQKVLESDPNNPEALEIYNASQLAQADRLRGQERYPEAMAALEAMTPDWPGSRTAVRELRTLMDELAEEHYRLGVKFFLDEELELAIQEWEAALALNPNHAKAASSIEEAKALLEALRKNRPVPPTP